MPWGGPDHALEHVAEELQRELFDDAGSMGALLETATLRAQIARFLRKHTNGHDEMGSSSVQS